MDLVTVVERLPGPGETVFGRNFFRRPGGKGLAQAVAAARLGVEVLLFGLVGQGPFGDELLGAAKENGVDVTFVERVRAQTGTATILVDEGGETMTAYAPGANALVDAAYLSRVLPVLSAADVLLLQLEIPVSVVAETLRRLPPERPLVILNPSPAQDLRDLPLKRVDVLVPGVRELQVLAGCTGTSEEIERASRVFLGLGAKAVVVMAGPAGAYLVEPEGFAHFSGFSEEATDPAVEDAFCAALGVRLGSGRGLYEAIGFANAAAALTATKKWAWPGFPTLSEVLEFLARFAG